VSGRDLSQTYIELANDTAGVRGPIIVWAQRLLSVLLIAASLERIVSHVALHKHLPSPTLTSVFVLYWLCTVAAPAVFGSHPQLGHEYAYSLLLGFAVLLASSVEADRMLVAARTALVAFVFAGLALIPVLPAMVLDQLYSQGLFAGLPRFGGLAAHPVAMGMFAQTMLLMVWALPFDRRWLNVLAWIAGLAALFMAQSKTAWIAFIVCSIAMFLVRSGSSLWQRITDPRSDGSLGIVVCLGAMTLVGAALGLVLVTDLGSQLQDFADTSQGAQLMSMTGRDRIWSIALEEWHSNVLFGYGPGLWDTDFRTSIGMANATDAHNQFMDTLARAGTVGAVGLVTYAGVLLAMSLRYAKATGGLSIALFLALALRSISEVPLLLFGYGGELFIHLLLLVTLAAAASARTQAQEEPGTYAYRTAS